MATTGFWPIKSRLKEVINHAENPVKTTNSKYLDDDLDKALRYTENDDKTDQKMYVTAINYPTKRAYAHMTETKCQYGKLGGNVVYHGFQSFRTGRKFENHISDHYKLREISDAVCREYGKSVLPPSKFTGSRKKDYWVKKNGNITHRDLLRQDIEQILPLCGNWEEFERRIRSLNYQFPRNQSYNHISITAPGWKRALRLDSLGYTDKVLKERFYRNRNSDRFYELRYTAYYKVKTYPLLQLEKQLDYEIFHSKDTAIVLVDVLFYMLLQLLHLTNDLEQQRLQNQPHSPAIRQSITMEKQLTEEYGFLKANDLHTEENILDFIDSCTDKIAALEQERQKITTAIAALIRRKTGQRKYLFWIGVLRRLPFQNVFLCSQEYQRASGVFPLLCL